MRIIFAAAFLCAMLPGGAAAISRDVVVSVYQGRCEDGNFDANLAAARKAVEQALARRSDFLVLPETFLSGYDTPERMRRGARPLDDPQVRAFIAESAKHQMVVIAGIARMTEQGIYNTALVIHGGKLLGTYDKIMLTEGDRDNLKFLPGREMPVFEAHGVRFAVIICHDSSFPHPAMIARLKGAEILFSPHYNDIPEARMDAHRRWVRNCHIGLACQMKMAVARANVVAKDKGGLGYGDSFIISPRGDMLAEADLFRQQMLTATIGVEQFQHPWADLNEVPAAVRAELADLLRKPDFVTEPRP